MELFDNFEDFECEESSISTSKQYPLFTPCIQNSNWFLKESDAESDFYRAVSFFDDGKVHDALKIFKRIHSSSKNNRFHEIMLLDSMLQCYIKIEPEYFDEVKVSELLKAFENILVDFGDQIQFLRTKSEVLARFEDNSEIIDTVSLLCSLSDLPENWLLFLGLKNKNRDFELCIYIKSMLCYESQLQNAHGFVKESIQRKIDDLKKFISKDSPEKIEKIRNSMKVSFKHPDEENSINESKSEFKAHDCRAKNRFISYSEKSQTLSNFRSRYSFLFSFLL